MGEFSTFHFPYTVEKENDMVYSLQYAVVQKAVENPWKTVFHSFPVQENGSVEVGSGRILVTPDPFLLVIAHSRGFFQLDGQFVESGLRHAGFLHDGLLEFFGGRVPNGQSRQQIPCCINGILTDSSFKFPGFKKQSLTINGYSHLMTNGSIFLNPLGVASRVYAFSASWAVMLTLVSTALPHTPEPEIRSWLSFPDWLPFEK